MDKEKSESCSTKSKKKCGKSQKSEVLNYLKSHKSISSMVAIDRFGATRLSDIIFRLRKDGYIIETSSVTTKNRYGHSTTYAEYSLVE